MPSPVSHRATNDRFRPRKTAKRDRNEISPKKGAKPMSKSTCRFLTRKTGFVTLIRDSGTILLNPQSRTTSH